MRISTATPETRFVLSQPASHEYISLTQLTSRSRQYVARGPQMGVVNYFMANAAAVYNQPAYNPMQPMNQFTDPINTTVLVDGLSGYVTEEELRSFFQGFGEITYVQGIRSATREFACTGVDPKTILERGGGTGGGMRICTKLFEYF